MKINNTSELRLPFMPMTILGIVHSFKPRTDAMQDINIIDVSIAKSRGVHENQSSILQQVAFDDDWEELGRACLKVVTDGCYPLSCDEIDELGP